MKTFLVIILYLIVGSFAGKIVSILANLAGGLGSIVGSLGQPNNVTGFRRGLALCFCTIMQAYVFLAWMAFVISYTMFVNRNQPVVRWLVWIVAAYACINPVIFSAHLSRTEEKEIPETENSVPNLSVSFNCLLVPTCFFLFICIPVLMLYGWPWVPYVRMVVHP